MKGIICYYSGSGNTKLACNYLKNKIKNIDFELFDIARNNAPDFSQYDFVGFATFTNFLAPSKLMYSFVEKISKQNNKNAFVFNTYGAFSGKTLKLLSDLVESAGFNVITGFSLHTPESYPPMRKMKMAFDNSPKEKELKEFNDFIADLDSILADTTSGKTVEKRGIKLSLLGKIIPSQKTSKAKEDFGIQNVDEKLCLECGTCMRGCPYEAITMNPKPVFDHNLCAGCWYCYNHCSQKAIYTKKFKGECQYPKPNEDLVNKLK